MRPAKRPLHNSDEITPSDRHLRLEYVGRWVLASAQPTFMARSWMQRWRRRDTAHDEDTDVCSLGTLARG